MKKFFLVLVLVLFTASLTFGADLALGGSVTESMTVALNPETITLNFDGVGGAVTSKVSILTVKSNKKAWVVKFSSLKNGVLKDDSLSAGTGIPYFVQVTPTYTGWNGTIDNTDMEDPVQLLVENQIFATGDSRTFKQGITFDVAISANTQNDTAILWEAGNTYSDTLTITISLN